MASSTLLSCLHGRRPQLKHLESPINACRLQVEHTQVICYWKCSTTTRGVARSPSPSHGPILQTMTTAQPCVSCKPNLFNQASTGPSLQVCDHSSSITIHVDMSIKSGSNNTYVVQHNDEFDTPRSPVINKTCYNDAVHIILRCSKSGTLQVYTFLFRPRPGILEGPCGYGAYIQKVHIPSPAYIPPSVYRAKPLQIE